MAGRFTSISGAVLVLALAGCHGEVEQPKENREEAPAAAIVPRRIADDLPGLHNVIRVSEQLYSGSEPEGDKGFAALASLGIKTVLSVDGARPDVDVARKNGVRYIHIPIGYDGVPERAAAALAHAARAAEGPIYVHCHHGRHRGPAAAAVLCAATGAARGKELLKVLDLAGTGKEYSGLWRDVEAFHPPAADVRLPDLVEIAEVGSFASAMAGVDRHWDNLKLCRDANWQTPASHPDLYPPQVTLLLREALHEARRKTPDGRFDKQFATWLGEAETLAAEIETQLVSANTEEAGRKSLLLEQACKQCHAKYRN